MSSHLYLADTSIWIDLFRLSAPARLQERVRLLGRSERLATNDVVRVEILIGARTKREFSEVDDELAGLLHLSIDASTWDQTTKLGFDLRRKGLTVPVPDLIIAASALEHGAVVIHSDKHFTTIAQHSDLHVESYVEAEI